MLGLTGRAETKPPAQISYNEHIRPILSDNCFACHGNDAAHRKANLRLDLADGATAERNGVRAIMPGDLEKSELWQRIISPHEDEVMPPPESHKPPLSPAQRELIKRWIEDGAVYQKHWAFEPVARPPVPGGGEGETEREGDGETGRGRGNPVDAFVAAKLAKQRLELAPETSREILLRRVTLDLIGLPPTTGEVENFLSDDRPDAYERVVERLLESPRYGEHFGRYWLDAVRYADTHGLHFDNIRTIWPYRDWVVQAFNRNLPFDRFTIEQIAGDMLPEPRIDQLVASGYNRNHLSTNEGGAIEAEVEMRNTADRVDTTVAVWLGLTANCASCHDHKFDPLTQRDYYALGAIFKGLADRVWDGNVRLPGPIALIAKDAATQRRIEELARAVVPLEKALRDRADQLESEHPVPKLEKKPTTYEVVWTEDSDLPTPANVRAPPPPGEWRSGAGVPVAGGARALRLDGPVERSLAFTAGDVDLAAGGEVTAFVHFNPDGANSPRAVSLEFVSEEKTTRKIWGDRWAFGQEVGTQAIHAGPLPAPGSYARLEIIARESGIESGKNYSGLRIAQSEGGAWWDRAGAVITSASAADDMLLSSAAWLRERRVSVRRFEHVPIRHDTKLRLGLSSALANDEDKRRLEEYHRDYIYAPLRAALEPEVHAVRRVSSEQIHYELTLPATLISRELPEPRPAHVMLRGQYDRPGEKVAAATPAFLPPAQRTGGRVTRLDFAQWLVDPRNPLTARVTVNRFWQQLFGAGIVRTPADFGVQGEMPTHPELLDWLASEFVRTGWDVKRLVRLLVTSRTYRQGSRVSPQLLELDPRNGFLARSSRLRLDAEVLRDQALAVAGVLGEEIGGPPVRPYQPGNVWEPVAITDSNTKTYVQDRGPALYRRSLYTFWKRTAPAPAMSTFDAPSRENFCVGRNRSNTPLQALALMNDVQQFEAARALAERMLLAAASEQERLAQAFRQVTARSPNEQEVRMLARTLQAHRAHFEKNTEEASKVLTNGESKPSALLPIGEFAAWTMVANLLMNLDETVTRN